MEKLMDSLGASKCIQHFTQTVVNHKVNKIHSKTGFKTADI